MKKSLPGFTLVLIMLINFVYIYDLGGSRTEPLSNVAIDNLREYEFNEPDNDIKGNKAGIQSKTSYIPSGWTYESVIELNPITPNTDYQVKIVLDPSNFNYSRANSNGSDIRFFDVNTNPLNYWIEDWNLTGSSIIWVKVPVSGTSQITMNYGNPTALSESDGDSTFVFFDDFTGTSVNSTKWTTVNGFSSATTVSSSIVSLAIDHPNDQGDPSGVGDFGSGLIAGFSDFQINQGVAGAGYATFQNTVSLGQIWGGGHNVETRNTGWSTTSTYVISPQEWLTTDIRWLNSSLVLFNNGSSSTSHTDSNTIPIGPLQVRIMAVSGYWGPGTWFSAALHSISSWGQAGRALRMKSWHDFIPDNGITPVEIQIDWLFVRNCADKESTATVTSALNLLSPEQKNYVNASQGYYPATYGFENDVQGITGTAIGFLDSYFRSGGFSTGIGIVDEYFGHKNLMHVTDTDPGNIVSGWHYFDTPPVAGTIEFYQLAQGSTGDQSFSLRAMDETNAFQMHVVVTSGVGYFQYYNGSAFQTIGNLTVDTWYHHSITFNCATGVNGTGTWIISYENGTEVGRVEDFDFNNNLNTIDTFYFTTHFASSQLQMLFDAFGFSWDSGYNIGDNFEEGLLLNFTTPTPLNWTGYSLDEGTNVTIRTNKTIPMPTPGSHTIQVFGNDSSGNWYKSLLTSFQFRFLDISSPENKSYLTAMSGYYPATYGFENQNDGETSIIGFTDHDETGCQSTIISSLDNHSKVLQMYDSSSFSALQRHAIDSPYLNGTVEFYIRTTYLTTVQTGTAWLIGSTGSLIRFTVGGNSFLYDNNTGTGVEWITITGGINANQWYHISLSYRCTGAPSYQGLTEGTWKVFIDGVEYGNFDLFTDEGPSYLQLGTRGAMGAQSYHYVYWDALGFSWDPYYQISDNLDEGILLNFTTPAPLDWVGYSLDGGNFITIPGNTTIPSPALGTHTIQVVGNNSFGFFQSDIESFEIAFETFTPNPPSISGPNDFSFDLGTMGYSIIWSAIDPNPANYTVYRNSTVYQNGTWLSTIIASLDGLEEGIHNFTCLVENSYGLQGSDEVWVTVFPGAPDTTPPTINSPADIVFEAGSIGYSILWSGADDRAPWWAEVFKNETLIYDQAWIGNDIEISLLGLIPGVHEYNCSLFDEA
ncbi:MAG: DUF2341 domain-containing protein, partial [Candidatus Kariarchaeaceae archaeon]